ncbi:MAG TPA: hypothetical protein VES89_02125 [Candidatus Competibacteraceae bacterium]|nr:hypothetical protein [Candidatus Competibacteraceae bacterium]
MSWCPSNVLSSLLLCASQRFTVCCHNSAGQHPARRIERHACDRVPVPFERTEQLYVRRQLFIRPLFLILLFVRRYTIQDVFQRSRPDTGRRQGGRNQLL